MLTDSEPGQLPPPAQPDFSMACYGEDDQAAGAVVSARHIFGCLREESPEELTQQGMLKTTGTRPTFLLGLARPLSQQHSGWTLTCGAVAALAVVEAIQSELQLLSADATVSVAAAAAAAPATPGPLLASLLAASSGQSGTRLEAAISELLLAVKHQYGGGGGGAECGPATLYLLAMLCRLLKAWATQLAGGPTGFTGFTAIMAGSPSSSQQVFQLPANGPCSAVYGHVEYWLQEAGQAGSGATLGEAEVSPHCFLCLVLPLSPTLSLLSLLPLKVPLRS